MIPKPIKPEGDPKSYRPLSLLAVPKRSSRGLSTPTSSQIINPLLPKEQAGFRCRKSTVDQVVFAVTEHRGFFRGQEEKRCRICRSDSAYDTA